MYRRIDCYVCCNKLDLAAGGDADKGKLPIDLQREN